MIVQIGEQWFPHRGGGADRYFHGLMQALAARRPERCTGAVFSGDEEGTRLSANVVSLGNSEQSLARRFRAVRRWAATEQAAQRQLAEGREVRKSGGQEAGGDALSHLSTFSPSTLPTTFATHFALYAWPIRRLLAEGRHVVHFHGPWALESAAEGGRPWSVWMKKALERRVYRTGDRFICLSQAFGDLLVRHYRIPAARVEIIPGGIEAGTFAVNATSEEARASLGWEAKHPTLLCVRRLARRMGLETLLEAFAEALAEIPQARLKIGGRGPLDGELRAQARRLGLEHAVEFLGFIPDEHLPLAYRAADLSIVPSQSLEGFGLITLESLASGTPVLVTPVGGLPEAVRGLATDLVLSGCTRKDLAKGIVEACQHPHRLPTAEACVAYVREHFDWSIIAERVWKVYMGVR
jgi:glycosyltransferase involved in cell wall biosynthesis